MLRLRATWGCRYGSVKKMLQAACDASGADMVVAQVQLPVR